VDRETTVAREGVDDTETSFWQEKEDIRNAEKAGFIAAQREWTFREKLNSIGDSLSHLQ
jgi:hypothetical protein